MSVGFREGAMITPFVVQQHERLTHRAIGQIRRASFVGTAAGAIGGHAVGGSFGGVAGAAGLGALGRAMEVARFNRQFRKFGEHFGVTPAQNAAMFRAHSGSYYAQRGLGAGGALGSKLDKHARRVAANQLGFSPPGFSGKHKRDSHGRFI